MRIALIGCGRWGRNILRDLLTLGCEVSIADPSYPSGPGVYQSIGGLAAAVNPDGVVVATPTSTHFEVLCEALTIFPAVTAFCEKPVTVSSRQAGDLERRFPGRIFVMEKWRYHGGILKLAEMAREKPLGAVLGLRTRRVGWGCPHKDVSAVWILMPHDLSIVQEILGGIPEARAAQLEIVSGVDLGMTAFLGAHPWVRCEVSAFSPIRCRSVELVCENGVASFDESRGPHVRIARGATDLGDITPEVEEVPIGGEMPLLRELSAYVGFLRGGNPAPKSTLREGAAVVGRIEELLTLARSGECR